MHLVRLKSGKVIEKKVLEKWLDKKRKEYLKNNPEVAIEVEKDKRHQESLRRSYDKAKSYKRWVKRK